MSSLRSTGIEILDRELGGGIPAGSAVLLSAVPATPAEQFLYELTTAGPTLYLTTERPAESVRAAIHSEGGSTENTDVYAVDDAAPVEDALTRIDRAPEGTNLIVDPVDGLERDAGERYRTFLAGVREEMEETGGFAMLHGLEGRQVSDRRDATEYFADVVFEFTTERNGEPIENRLVVPKFRGGRPFEEALKLKLRDRIVVDTSRDIA